MRILNSAVTLIASRSERSTEIDFFFFSFLLLDDDVSCGWNQQWWQNRGTGWTYLSFGFCLFGLIPSSMSKLIHNICKFKHIFNKTTVTVANVYANEQFRLCFYVNIGEHLPDLVSSGEYCILRFRRIIIILSQNRQEEQQTKCKDCQ